MITWIMLIKGPDKFKYTKAEPPCNKGSIQISFHWFHIVIGWQKGEETR